MISQLKKEFDVGVDTEFISPEEAIKKYSFIAGHFLKDGMIYIISPTIDNYCIPFFDYSHVLAKEKESAFKQILGCLGAKEITLKRVNVYSKSGELETHIPIQKVIAQLGFNASVLENGTLKQEIYQQYGKPKNSPYIPNDLVQWVELDPDLRVLARGRLENNLIRMQVTLEFREDMNFDASLMLNIKKIASKLGLSANIVNMNHSRWYFDVEFWPVD